MNNLKINLLIMGIAIGTAQATMSKVFASDSAVYWHSSSIGKFKVVIHGTEEKRGIAEKIYNMVVGIKDKMPKSGLFNRRQENAIKNLNIDCYPFADFEETYQPVSGSESRVSSGIRFGSGAKCAHHYDHCEIIHFTTRKIEANKNHETEYELAFETLRFDEIGDGKVRFKDDIAKTLFYLIHWTQAEKPFKKLRFSDHEVRETSEMTCEKDGSIFSCVLSIAEIKKEKDNWRE